MLTSEEIKSLDSFAKDIRYETINALGKLGFGHVGGCMSVCELLSVLYGKVMNINPKEPKWPERDKLVMSKGHAGPAVYAALALKGYFDKELLNTINKNGTALPSHCDRNLTPGIDMTTGSLGQGASLAVGLALAAKIEGSKRKTYVCIGDGESQEGQVWEAAMYAAQQKLSGLIAFLDYNKQQLDGFTKDINDLRDIRKKFEDFGWYAQEVNGHSVEEIYNAVEKAKEQTEMPSMIILHTKKGYGCSFAEDVFYNHHMTFTKEQAEEALEKVNLSRV